MQHHVVVLLFLGVLLGSCRGGGAAPDTGFALELMGDGGRVTFPLPLLGDRTTFTLEMWIKLWHPPVPGAPNPERNMIYSESYDGGGQFNGAQRIFTYVSQDNPDNSNDTLGATTLSSWPSDGAPTAFTGPLPQGVWFHLAYVRDGGTLRIFVNGLIAAEGPALTYSGPPPTQFHLGLFVNPVSGNEWGRFLVDELRVSSTARYAADFTPDRICVPDADTLSLWHFDEEAGPSTTDAMGTMGDAAVSASVVRVVAIR